MFLSMAFGKIMLPFRSLKLRTVPRYAIAIVRSRFKLRSDERLGVLEQLCFDKIELCQHKWNFEKSQKKVGTP
jgi:hypothetical protein